MAELKSLHNPSYEVVIVAFEPNLEEIKRVRETVFVQEQSVPLELEWDGLDQNAEHAVARLENGEIVGTARLLKDGHIGRMAVLQEWRGMGIGSKLLKTLCRRAKELGMEKVMLAAQVQACGFYEKHNFTAEGDTFLDAGIPHRNMFLSIKNNKNTL